MATSVAYDGDGVRRAFKIGFPWGSVADIGVRVYTLATGVERELGRAEYRIVSDCVVYDLKSGERIIIYLASPLAQALALQEERVQSAEMAGITAETALWQAQGAASLAAESVRQSLLEVEKLDEKVAAANSAITATVNKAVADGCWSINDTCERARAYAEEAIEEQVRRRVFPTFLAVASYGDIPCDKPGFYVVLDGCLGHGPGRLASFSPVEYVDGKWLPCDHHGAGAEGGPVAKNEGPFTGTLYHVCRDGRIDRVCFETFISMVKDNEGRGLDELLDGMERDIGAEIARVETSLTMEIARVESEAAAQTERVETSLTREIARVEGVIEEKETGLAGEIARVEGIAETALAYNPGGPAQIARLDALETGVEKLSEDIELGGMRCNSRIIIEVSQNWKSPVTGWCKATLVGGGGGGYEIANGNWCGGGSSGEIVTGCLYLEKDVHYALTIGACGLHVVQTVNPNESNASLYLASLGGQTKIERVEPEGLKLLLKAGGGACTPYCLNGNIYYDKDTLICYFYSTGSVSRIIARGGGLGFPEKPWYGHGESCEWMPETKYGHTSGRQGVIILEFYDPEKQPEALQ